MNFKFNRASCILFGNPIPSPYSETVQTKLCIQEYNSFIVQEPNFTHMVLQFAPGTLHISPGDNLSLG